MVIKKNRIWNCSLQNVSYVVYLGINVINVVIWMAVMTPGVVIVLGGRLFHSLLAQHQVDPFTASLHSPNDRQMCKHCVRELSAVFGKRLKFPPVTWVHNTLQFIHNSVQVRACRLLWKRWVCIITPIMLYDPWWASSWQILSQPPCTSLTTGNLPVSARLEDCVAVSVHSSNILRMGWVDQPIICKWPV